MYGQQVHKIKLIYITKKLSAKLFGSRQAKDDFQVFFFLLRFAMLRIRDIFYFLAAEMKTKKLSS